MRIASLMLLSAALSPAYQLIQAGSGRKDNGTGFRYETRLEPQIAGQKVTGFAGGGIIVGTNFHRVLEDDTTHRYVGYDLTVNKRADGTLVVTLGQLSLPEEKLGLTGIWTRVPLRVNSGSQAINPGDEIAIDMFTNSDTGQKIVDYLFFDEAPSALRLPEGSPRDFTVNDVPLTLTSTKISLNGKRVQSADKGSISGEAIHFYMPGHGRFAMSLAPNLDLGFRKLGEVRGSRITFRSGDDIWTLDTDLPVAPGGGVFNLYVYPDPAWRPSTGPDMFQLGASSARAMIRR